MRCVGASAPGDTGAGLSGQKRTCSKQGSKDGVREHGHHTLDEQQADATPRTASLARLCRPAQQVRQHNRLLCNMWPPPPAHSSTTVSLATTRSMGVSWTSGGMLQAGFRAGSIGAEVAGRVRGRWHCSGAGTSKPGWFLLLFSHVSCPAKWDVTCFYSTTIQNLEKTGYQFKSCPLQAFYVVEPNGYYVPFRKG